MTIKCTVLQFLITISAAEEYLSEFQIECSYFDTDSIICTAMCTLDAVLSKIFCDVSILLHCILSSRTSLLSRHPLQPNKFSGSKVLPMSSHTKPTAIIGHSNNGTRASFEVPKILKLLLTGREPLTTELKKCWKLSDIKLLAGKIA